MTEPRNDFSTIMPGDMAARLSGPMQMPGAPVGPASFSNPTGTPAAPSATAAAPVQPKAPTGDTAAVAAPSAGGAATAPQASAGEGAGGGGGSPNSFEGIMIALIAALFGIDLGNVGRMLTGGQGGYGKGTRGAGSGWNEAALPKGAVVNGNIVPVEVKAGTRTAADVVLEVARSQIGVREVGNNGGSHVAMYHTAGGAGVGDPWCASFVSFVYQRAGITDIGTASSLAVGSQFGSAFHRGSSNYIPQPGDSIIFKRTGGGHIGLVDSVTPDGKGDYIVKTIEGNKSDQVMANSSSTTYKLSELKNSGNFVGFGSLEQLVQANAKTKERFKPKDAAAEGEVTKADLGQLSPSTGSDGQKRQSSVSLGKVT